MALEASHTAVKLSAHMTTKIEGPRIDVGGTAGDNNPGEQGQQHLHVHRS